LACRTRSIEKKWIPRTVSIVIAVRNGERYIREKLDSVLALDYPKELLEVWVASDGSRDKTDDIVREFAWSGIQLVRIPESGKAAALNAAIRKSEGEILLLTDVRQKLATDSLSRLVSCFADPTVGVVSGRLLICKGENREEANIGLYWRYETWIRDNLSRIDSIFGATGALYAIRRKLAVRMPEQILLDDVYMPLSAFFAGYRLIVEPAALVYDVPTPLNVEFRRKVRTLAGNYQLLRYYPQLLTSANRMWLHFVSYKLGRLLLPFALITIALGSCWLPMPWKWIFIVLQGAFYGLAYIDNWIPEGATAKRISSPVHVFVTMMLAAFCAVAIFCVPPQALWKGTTAPRLPGAVKSQSASSRSE
jgi:cellulose synthase/poly-beta-1,6-N-acetylglucosamine synthase-like glycosyltransferase